MSAKTKPVTTYTLAIMRVAKCDSREAHLIEDVMRGQSPCLDGLDKPDFDLLALESQEMLKDDELRAYAEEAVFGLWN